jgi:antitoxin (DNA-binding transcriptional repressor) of toxin-antitoxin stability system
MAIQHVSLREANQRLSKYIEMASQGSDHCD